MIGQVLNVTQKGLKLEWDTLVLEEIVVLEGALDSANFVFVLDFTPWQLTY